MNKQKIIFFFFLLTGTREALSLLKARNSGFTFM